METNKELPKWIDNLKGKDPTIDSLIEYIEDSRQSAPLASAPAVAVVYISESDSVALSKMAALAENTSTTIRVHNRNDKWHWHTVALHTAAPQPAAAPVAAAVVQGASRNDMAKASGLVDFIYEQIGFADRNKLIADVAARLAAAPQPPANAALVDAKPSRVPEKALFWLSCLTKCARLLNLPDDEPIPSGVVKAIEKLTAHPSTAQPDAHPLKCGTTRAERDAMRDAQPDAFQQGRAAGLESAWKAIDEYADKHLHGDDLKCALALIDVVRSLNK